MESHATYQPFATNMEVMPFLNFCNHSAALAVFEEVGMAMPVLSILKWFHCTHCTQPCVQLILKYFISDLLHVA